MRAAQLLLVYILKILLLSGQTDTYLHWKRIKLHLWYTGALWAPLERNGEGSVNELHTLDNMWLLLLLFRSQALFLSILYISGIRTGSHFSVFVFCICNFFPFVLSFNSGPADQSTGRDWDSETAPANSKYTCTHTPTHVILSVFFCDIQTKHILFSN